MAKAKKVKVKKLTVLQQKDETIKGLRESLADYRKQEAHAARELEKADQHNKTVALILGIRGEQQGSTYDGFGSRSSTTELPLQERIIQAVMKLRESFAREDEGSMIEVEKSEQLMEVLGIVLDDPTRKMQEHRRMIIAKGVAEGKIDPRYLDERTNVQRRDDGFRPNY